jgi:hypothetical protein
MKFKKILDFVKSANYGKEISVLPGYKILGSIITLDDLKEQFEDDEMWCATVPLLDKEDGNVIDFVICIGKEFYKNHKNREDMFKFVLLHEVGHVNTYQEGVFDSEEEEAIWELEAQLWAIKRAKEMGLKHVSKKAFKNFQTWSTMDDPYRKAKGIYDNGGIIEENEDEDEEIEID